ncbi:MAG: lipocalin family protein [Ferruginibacter sp.]
MKKLFYIFAIFSVVVTAVSCSGSKEARTNRSKVNGKWQLQTVVSEGIVLASQTKAELLNEADLKCFVGSSWSFNSLNSLGTYSINQNGGECAAVTRNIRWSIYEANGQPNILQFKKVDNKYKDIEEGNVGYRFTILQLDNTSMKLRSDVTFEGKPASFIYNFVKN